MTYTPYPPKRKIVETVPRLTREQLEEQILQVEIIYEQALESSHFHTALKAQEMLHRLLLLLQQQKQNPLTLADLTREDIASLLQGIETIRRPRQQLRQDRGANGGPAPTGFAKP